jgi:hypothetical protein
VLVAERHYKEANRIISGVIQTFEKGSEYGRLTDALTIQGVVWARLSLHESSLQILRHTISVAQDSGAYSNAGRAALTLIEEHGKDRLSDMELYEVYRRADICLKETEDAEEITRLRACARILSRRIIGVRISDKDFVLPDVIHDYEAKFIREALEAEHGIVTHAAKRLGISHQSLIRALETRHQELLSLRTPARVRRKSILSKR